MRKLLLLGMVGMFFLQFISCGKINAANYNNTIAEPSREMQQFNLTLQNPPSMDEFSSARDAVVEIAKKGVTEIEALSDFDGNTSFKEAALAYYNYSTEYYHDETIGKRVKDYINGESTMTNDELKVAEEKDKKLFELNAAFLDEQQKFAENVEVPLEY